MRRRISGALLLATLAFGAACYHTRVLTPDIPASSDYIGPYYSNVFFWGLLKDDIIAQEQDGKIPCASNAFQEVRVTTKLPYAVMTVVTLGIWSRIEVTYKCAKEPPPSPPSGLPRLPSETAPPPPTDTIGTQAQTGTQTSTTATSETQHQRLVKD